MVARAKVKAAKVEQWMVKRDKKLRELKQKVVQGLKAAREQWEHLQLKMILG